MEKNPLYAVLTGDIVKSSKLDPPELETVRKRLLESIEDIKEWQPGLVKSKADFFRGDSWQLLLADPGKALRVAVFLRASVLVQGKSDTRISIGVGPVTRISPSRVSLSTGEAFEASGTCLDEMPVLSKMAFSGPSLPPDSAGLLGLIVRLADALIGHWTSRQAEAVRLAAVPGHGATQELLSAKMDPPVKRQSLSDILRAANWPALEAAINRLEEMKWETRMQA